MEINRLDGSPARKVWHNYWDSRLTYHKAYIARLNYVHNNPVKHGLVPVASNYRWCSAAWFERTASAGWLKTVSAFKTDQLKIPDDFEADQDSSYNTESPPGDEVAVECGVKRRFVRQEVRTAMEGHTSAD